MTHSTLIRFSRWCSIAVVTLWAVNAARWLTRPEIHWYAAVDVPLLVVAVLAWSNLRHLKSMSAKDPALLHAPVRNLPVRLAIATTIGLAAFAFGAGIAMH